MDGFAPVQHSCGFVDAGTQHKNADCIITEIITNAANAARIAFRCWGRMFDMFFHNVGSSARHDYDGCHTTM